MKAERIYAGYLALQAVLGILLWVGIAASSTVRSGFDLIVERPEVTDAFFAADMVVVVTSALSAWAIATERSWAVPAVAFTAGGVVYPTVYLFGWATFTEGSTGTVALAVMLGVSLLTCWVAYQTFRTQQART